MVQRLVKRCAQEQGWLMKLYVMQAQEVREAAVEAVLRRRPEVREVGQPVSFQRAAAFQVGKVVVVEEAHS